MCKNICYSICRKDPPFPFSFTLAPCFLKQENLKYHTQKTEVTWLAFLPSRHSHSCTASSMMALIQNSFEVQFENWSLTPSVSFIIWKFSSQTRTCWWLPLRNRINNRWVSPLVWSGMMEEFVAKAFPKMYQIDKKNRSQNAAVATWKCYPKLAKWSNLSLLQSTHRINYAYDKMSISQ